MATFLGKWAAIYFAAMFTLTGLIAIYFAGATPFTIGWTVTPLVLAALFVAYQRASAKAEKQRVERIREEWSKG